MATATTPQPTTVPRTVRIKAPINSGDKKTQRLGVASRQSGVLIGVALACPEREGGQMSVVAEGEKGLDYCNVHRRGLQNDLNPLRKLNPLEKAGSSGVAREILAFGSLFASK